MSVTAATCVTRLRYKLKDPDETQYPDAELFLYLNEAVRAMIRRIAVTSPQFYLRTSYTQKAQTNLVSGTSNYDLPEGLWTVVQVETTDSDDDTIKRDTLTLERTLDTDADGYFLKDDDIYLYPAVDENVVNGLTIYYVPKPDEVAAGVDVVPLGDDFEDVIVTWATILAKSRQGEKTGDFGAVYQMLSEAVNAMVSNVNLPEDAGLHTLWRPWI